MGKGFLIKKGIDSGSGGGGGDSDCDITVNRISPSVVTTVLDLDFDSKNQALSQNIAEVVADITINTLNTTNAEFGNFLLLVQNTVILSFDTNYTDTVLSTTEGTWDSGNQQLTIDGTGEIYEVSVRFIGTTRSWTVQKYGA